MGKPDGQQLRPLRAALLALLLGVLGLGPALLPSRSLLPEDPRIYAPLGADLSEAQITEARSAAVPSRRDAILQFLPFDTSVGQAWRAGRVPLWETRYLCGAPMLAQGTSRAFYPSAVLAAFWGPGRMRATLWLLHLMLAGLFAYLLARRLGAREGGGLLANASIVLSGYAWAHVQHPMIFMAALWLLPALLATDKILDTRTTPGSRLRNQIGLALAVALSWYAGFVQASVVLVYVTAAYAALLAFTRWRHEARLPLRELSACGLSIAVGLLLAAIQILPSLELAEHSARLAADASSQIATALKPIQLLDLVLPGQLAAPGDLVVAGSPRPSWLALFLMPESALPTLANGTYNHSETAVGFGIWPLIFALFACASLFSKETPRRSARSGLALFAVLALLGCMATPGLFQVLRLLPGVGVGDLKRLLLVPGLLLPVLAACGFRRPGPGTAMGAVVLGFVMVAAGLALFAAKQESLAARLVSLLAWRRDYPIDSVASAFADGELAANQILLARGVLLAGLVLLVGGALGRLRRGQVALFICLTSFELLPVAWATTPAPSVDALDAKLPAALSARLEDRSEPKPRPAPRLLRLDTAPGGHAQVTLWPPNLPLRSGFADLLGYAPLPPRRLEDFAEALELGSASGGAGIGRFRKLTTLTRALSKLMAPEYLVTQAAASALPVAIRDDWQEIAHVREAHVFVAKQPEPRVRLYHSAQQVTRARVASKLSAPDFDPTQELILESTPPAKLGPASAEDSATVLSWNSGRIEVAYSTQAAAMLFVAESWMPGWTATIDCNGKQFERTSVPAQLAFQAIAVPAGQGRVQLRYAPTSFSHGLLLAGLGILGLLTLIVKLALEALRRPRRP